MTKAKTAPATSDHGILELRQFLEKMHEVLKRMQSIFLRRLDDTVDRCTGLRASWRVSKNWLFSNTSRGAKASTIIYSIIETAKANNLNPFLYLTHLFEQLPQLNSLTNGQALDRLVPWSQSLPLTCRVFTRKV